MSNHTTQNLIDETRQRANMENMDLALVPEILARINDAYKELYKLVVSVDESYYTKTYNFNLPDTVLQAAYTAQGLGTAPTNFAAMPPDFWRAVLIEYNQNTPRPLTVHMFNIHNKNDYFGLMYKVIGRSAGLETLEVVPPQRSAGPYVLSYTPYLLPLALMETILYHTPTVIPVPVVYSTDAVVASTGVWTFSTATFDASYVGGKLTVSGASHPGNNGTFVILSQTTHTLTTATTGLVNETFITPTAASATKPPYDNVVASTNTWYFGNATFTPLDVGSSFTVTSAANAGNNGTFYIASYISAQSVTTVPAALVNETFAPNAVTMNIQPGGTVGSLDNTLEAYSKYITVTAAIDLLDKEESEAQAEDLMNIKKALTEEVLGMAANRDSEPETIGIVDNQRGGWPDWTGLGPWYPIFLFFAVSLIS